MGHKGDIDPETAAAVQVGVQAVVFRHLLDKGDPYADVMREKLKDSIKYLQENFE